MTSKFKDKRMIELSEEDFAVLAICAIRYCQGRQTYMPGLVRDIVRPHLANIPDNNITVMLNDCEDQKKFGMYGDERIDKPGWLEWEQELKKEKERRDG